MVQFTPNAQGQIVTAYTANPEFGYAILSSVETIFQNGWMQDKKRSTIIKGSTEGLTRMALAMPTMEGRISVTECLEDNIPHKFLSQMDKKKPHEEKILPFIKKSSENGPVLTAGGLRILRFTEYDSTGSSVDIRIAHENHADVIAHNAQNADADTANLP